MTQRSTITAIELSKNNKHRYHIYIDDTYAFTVHEDVLVKHRLTKGRELDEHERQTIMSDEEHNQAFQQALKWITARDRSSFEIRQRLLHKGYAEEAIEAALEKMESLGLVDDLAYAERLVRQRLHSQSKGKRFILHELKEKGIADEVIAHALQHVDDESEREAAMRIARKRYRPMEDEASELKNLRRLSDYLLRRGFSPSLVQQVVRCIHEESTSS